MHGYILGKRHRQVKTEAQVGVALGKAVNLLLGLAAGLGQQHLTGFNDRGVQGGKAVPGVSLGQNVLYPLELYLLGGEKLHKAGQGSCLYTFHAVIHPFSKSLSRQRGAEQIVFASKRQGPAPWGKGACRSIRVAAQERKGALPGLMASRQSRSPRLRPRISISAVARLVATGMLYWSHSRMT